MCTVFMDKVIAGRSGVLGKMRKQHKMCRPACCCAPQLRRLHHCYAPRDHPVMLPFPFLFFLFPFALPFLTCMADDERRTLHVRSQRGCIVKVLHAQPIVQLRGAAVRWKEAARHILGIAHLHRQAYTCTIW